MSCLFISLGKLLKVDSTKLRQQICDFIISNPNATWNGTKIHQWIEWVAGDEYKTIDRYIKEMRNLNRWGGAPEIAICCLIYNISVKVVNYRDKNSNVMFNEETLPPTSQTSQMSKTSQTPQMSQISTPTTVTPVSTPIDHQYIEKKWKEYLGLLYKKYNQLEKMSKFPQNHPLKRNHNNFIMTQKKHFDKRMFNELRKEQNVKQNVKQNVQKSKPLLKISWTGYHYEPLEIVN